MDCCLLYMYYLTITNFQSRNSAGTGENSENCGIREEEQKQIDIYCTVYSIPHQENKNLYILEYNIYLNCIITDFNCKTVCYSFVSIIITSNLL